MYKTITLFGKTKGGWGREGKEGKRGEGRRKRKYKFFHFLYLVCKEKMEGNTRYWWVPPKVLSLISHFPSNLGKKNMVGNKGIFSFIFLSFTPIPPNQTK